MRTLTDIAGELKMTNKELRAKMAELGLKLKANVRKIDERTAARIVKAIQKTLPKEVIKKPEKKEIIRPEKIVIPQTITVRDFAKKLSFPVTRIIEELMKNGILASINEEIDFETAAIIAEDLGMTIQKEKALKEIGLKTKLQAELAKEDRAKLKPRPPIVVVMGHVDHGKTTLLDAIRQTEIAKTEAGAITQHIGAYQVSKKGKLITFLDTPGHEAFVAMRERGARVTDIAVLVVAADDGVQPQTKEAIKHARNFKLPIIVAINKIDKPEADPERVKKQLSDLDLIPEEWGGKTIFVPVSAKQRKNLDQLLEMILLQAEIEELKANPEASASGTVIEAHLDPKRGPMTTALIQNGTLKVNQAVTVGDTYGIVKRLENFQGKPISHAKPSTPVRILGLEQVPEVGEIIIVEKSKEEARAKVEQLLKFKKKIAIKPKEQIKARKKINLIIKADTLGSLEAILKALARLETVEVAPVVINYDVGKITESDVQMSQSVNAQILGFHTEITPVAKRLAEAQNVLYKTYTVIYNLIEDVKRQLEALIEPEIKEITLGKLKVLAIFRSEKLRKIIGGKVILGKVKNKTQAKVFQDNKIIGEGKIANLQINKVNIDEVDQGKECGLLFEGETKIKTGDLLEIFHREIKKKRIL